MSDFLDASEIFIFFNFFNLCLCILFILRDLLVKKTSYFLSYVFVAIALSYVVSPFGVFFFEFGVNPHQEVEVATLRGDMVYASVVVSIFLLGTILGFLIPNTRRFVSFEFEKTELPFVLILFVIVLFCFYFFVSSYGGVEYVLNNISRIRSGTDENKNYLGAFVRLFTYYIEFLVFFFYVRFFINKNLKNFLLFIIIFALGVAKAVLDGGRGGLINLFIGILFLSIYLKGGRMPLIYLLICFAIALIVGLYGKVYIFQIVGNTDVVLQDMEYLVKFEKVLKEYSHQFHSLVVAINHELGGDRLFQDFYVWILKPLKLFGYDIPDSISYYNTNVIKGVWDSEIPPGIVAFSYYEGGGLFVPLLGIFFGFLIKHFDSLVVNTISSNGNVSLTYPFLAIVSIYMPFAFSNSDPALFIQWTLAYTILFGSVYFTRKLKFKNLKI